MSRAVTESFTARRSAAALALRWHARTGTLVALTAALTFAGALPALSLLGGGTAAPTLTLSLADTPLLRADWGAKAVVWPQLQQLALMQLLSIVRGAVWLTLAIGAATLIALHLARAAARGSEVIVARAVGASRRDILAATFLEAAALAVIALSIGAALAMVANVALRNAWPGPIGSSAIAMTAAGTCAVSALILSGPLLLTRALTTRRLVDDDRRPLALIIPAMQLGAALVVLAGGFTLRRAMQIPQHDTNTTMATTMLQTVRAVEPSRLARAQQFAVFLEAQQSAHPEALVSLASSGAHRGFGAMADAITDCGECSLGGYPVRNRSETVMHAAVSGDSFALSGLRLLAGRALTNHDRWDAPLVAVVSAQLARDLFQNGNAVGRRIKLELLGGEWFEVVGVVDDAQSSALGAAMRPPYTVYVSVLQHPVGQIEVGTRNAGVSPDALATIGTATSAVSSLADRAATERRVLSWFTTLLSGMGLVAALIAIGGLLVMLRLWLDSQRLEVGVHRAVGARRLDIQRMVLGRASIVAAGGSAFGAWLGLIAWDVLPRVIPGATMWDGQIVLVTALGLSTLTLLTAALVAQRFTRTPVSALLLDVG